MCTDCQSVPFLPDHYAQSKHAASCGPEVDEPLQFSRQSERSSLDLKITCLAPASWGAASEERNKNWRDATPRTFSSPSHSPASSSGAAPLKSVAWWSYCGLTQGPAYPGCTNTQLSMWQQRPVSSDKAGTEVTIPIRVQANEWLLIWNIPCHFLLFSWYMLCYDLSRSLGINFYVICFCVVTWRQVALLLRNKMVLISDLLFASEWPASEPIPTELA